MTVDRRRFLPDHILLGLWRRRLRYPERQFLFWVETSLAASQPRPSKHPRLPRMPSRSMLHGRQRCQLRAIRGCRKEQRPKHSIRKRRRFTIGISLISRRRRSHAPYTKANFGRPKGLVESHRLAVVPKGWGCCGEW